MKTRTETETIIRQSAADKEWVVFSEDPKIIRRMEKLFGQGRRRSDVGTEWIVPQRCIRIAAKRSMTPEQSEAAKARLAKARQQKPA